MSKQRTNKRSPILTDGQHKHSSGFLEVSEGVYVICGRRNGQLSDITLTGKGRTGVVLCNRATGERLITRDSGLRGATLEYIPNLEMFLGMMADAGLYRGFWFTRDEGRICWMDLSKWREFRG